MKNQTGPTRHPSSPCAAPRQLIGLRCSRIFPALARTVAAGLAFAACVAQAQSPGADSFNPAANDWVATMAMQPDGKLLVGGTFTAVGGKLRSRVARLNPDGTADTVFNPGASGGVYYTAVSPLIVQPDGKLLAGGGFTSLGGRARSFLGRLNADGTLDTGFNPVADQFPYAMVLQADARILLGGPFYNLAGAARKCVGRLLPTGTLDSAFNPGADASVFALALQADGGTVLGGAFSTLAGQPRSYIGRLNADATLDPGFNPGADMFVFALAEQPDGKILVGGSFTQLGGQPRNRLGRLNPDGSLDLTFNPGANDVVYTFALQTDGRILVGGNFTTLGGQSRSRIARLHSDGTLDTAFNPVANDGVSSLAIQPDGRILVAGDFTTLGGKARAHIGRLTISEPATQSLSYDGAAVTWLRGGTSPEVWRTSFEVSTDGSNWSGLGAGVRIPGGWRLNNVSIPAGASLRARGWVVASSESAGWFVEDTLSLEAPMPIVLATSIHHDGTNATLQLTTPSGPRYRLEASSDLTNWVSLGVANPSAMGNMTVVDARASRRFYRAAVPRATALAPFAPPSLPEGLAMDETGNAYLSMAPTGEIWRIAPDGSESKYAQVPTLVAGLTVGPSNALYAAVAPQPADPSQHGVWRIQTNGTAAVFAILPPDSLPNDVVFDSKGRLFVTDSIGGRIFRIDDAGVASVWAQSALLVGAPNPQPPHPPSPLGANGLAFVGTNAFVCNTDLGTLVRIPVNADGSAGTPEVFIGGALLGGADGLKADAAGNLYVANVIQSTVVRVSPSGAMEVIANGRDGLDSPSSLCFGTLPGQRLRLFAVNYATISASIPGGNPMPGFLRIDTELAATLAVFPPPSLPEGLAMDDAGNAYLSMAPTGEIWRIAPDGSKSKYAQVPTLVAGLAVGPSNALYVAVAPQPADPSQHGVWRIPTNGTPALFAVLPPDSLPNDVVFDAAGRLFATDSIGGRIFRIDDAGAASVWTQNPLLAGAPNPVPPHPPFPIGANGLAFVGTNAFVCNTDLGMLVRIPVNADGNAGTPEVLVGGALLGGADGLRADASGDLYVANVIQNLIVRVTPKGAMTTVADGVDGLDSPSSLCFGQWPGYQTRLFVVNYSTISASIPSGNPRPALLRINRPVSGPDLP